MKVIYTVIFCFVGIMLMAQNNNLRIDYRAVDDLLEWFENNDTNINSLANLPANQAMEIIYHQNNDRNDTTLFRDCLENFNPEDTSNRQYGLHSAYKNRNEIQELFNGIKSTNFDSSIETIAPLFPAEDIEELDCQVYYCLTGWKWGDAMKFNSHIENGKLNLTDTGTSTLLFNLSIVTKTYGITTEQRLSTFKNVFTHELFHAIYGEYYEKRWPNTKYNGTQNTLKYILINEGIAHYLGTDKKKFKTYKHEALELYSKFNETFCDENIANLNEKEKYTLISQGMHGHSKYVSKTGMYMAVTIANELGMDGLKSCIENGADYFINTYNDIAKQLGDEYLIKIPKGF